MNKVAVILIGLLTWLYGSFAFAQTPALPPNLATADWTLKQAKILNAESNDAVWKFMIEVWSTIDLPGSGKVCEFHFADLRCSGELSLVVVYDGGGTADCNYVDIFDKSLTGIEDYDFNTSTPVYFNSIQDINRDGNYEVVLDAVFVAGGIDECTATWPVIYGWNGTGYADVSTEFKGYYRKTLADLERRVTPLPPTPAPHQVKKLESHIPGLEVEVIAPPQEIPMPPPDTDSDCLKAEAAKIQRFLGSRDAGMSDAIEWANSDNTHDRDFAISILFDIGTSEAARYLRTLSKDTDRNIARSAKDVLRFVPKTRPAAYPTIHGELYTQVTGAPLPK